MTAIFMFVEQLDMCQVPQLILPEDILHKQAGIARLRATDWQLAKFVAGRSEQGLHLKLIVKCLLRLKGCCIDM